MAIHRLLYRSDMDLIGTDAAIGQQVTEIVCQSAERNAANALTGALLYTRGVFIQALEGPLPALEATFERICCDLRHRRVELLEFVQADARVFGEWAMVRVSASHAVEAYLPSLAALTEQTSETVSAQTTVHLMRSMLVAGSIVNSAACRMLAV
ncbi:MAG: BLUF domain-containing protein [Methylorubrum rhodinum]|uniref:BLUF domain-containing protein n=1 Tax=Methylorubrum rhodinum TaxID=29428 RepID=UPI003BB02B4B